MQQLLKTGCEALGIALTEEQGELLWQYILLLEKWNKVVNLTAITDRKEMLIHHLLDSLAIAFAITGDNIIDVGTGAGLPGIPLAILYPEKQFTLLDSRAKKIQFIQQVIITLPLKNIVVVQNRVEKFFPSKDKKFDIVVTRAFASLDKMWSLCTHLISTQGIILAMKGRYPEAEIALLPPQVGIMAETRLHIPGLSAERYLLQLHWLE